MQSCSSNISRSHGFLKLFKQIYVLIRRCIDFSIISWTLASKSNQLLDWLHSISTDSGALLIGLSLDREGAQQLHRHHAAGGLGHIRALQHKLVAQQELLLGIAASSLLRPLISLSSPSQKHNVCPAALLCVPTLTVPPERVKDMNELLKMITLEKARNSIIHHVLCSTAA